MPTRSSKPIAAALSLAAALGLTACEIQETAQGTGGADPMIDLEPRDPAQAAVQRANLLASQGGSEEALELFERAIEINPRMTVAYLGAAEIYRESGDFQSALDRAETAVDLEPALFDAQFQKALALQLLDRLPEAVRTYLQALRLRPSDFEANLNLATTYLQLSEPAQARLYAEQAVRLQPDNGPARVNLGAVYAALDLHQAAVIEYQQAAELMALNSELLLNLADSLGQSGRYEEMAATLDQLLRIEDSAIARERLGSALFRLRRYDEALDQFEVAADLDPTHYPAWNGVGVCLLNRWLFSERADQNAHDRAIDALRRSLRLQSAQSRIIELIRRYG